MISMAPPMAPPVAITKAITISVKKIIFEKTATSFIVGIAVLGRQIVIVI